MQAAQIRVPFRHNLFQKGKTSYLGPPTSMAQARVMILVCILYVVWWPQVSTASSPSCFTAKPMREQNIGRKTHSE